MLQDTFITEKNSSYLFTKFGLSNAINPLVSIFTQKNIFNPSLLIIGWRGAPGLKDEPQHLTKGLITKDLLRLAGIKYCILDNEKI